MKKLLLVSAIAALTVSAHAAPELYGRADMDIRYEEDGDISMDNGSSRVGIKGSMPMTSTLDAIYQLEWKVDIDNDGGVLESRDTYLGVQGDTFGTLVGGHLTAIDDVINYTNPSDYWNAGVLGSFDGNRLKNSVAYFTPDYNGLQFMSMYKFQDGSKGAEDKSDTDGSGSFGVGAKYENGPLSAGITYIQANDNGAADFDDIRVSGAYDLTDSFTLSGLYQIIDFDGSDDEENSYIVAAEYDIPASKWDVYAEYDGVTNALGVKDADVDVFSVGGNYSFAKGLSAGVYAGVTDVDGGDDKFGVGSRLTYKF